jgi:hypothetical protein
MTDLQLYLAIGVPSVLNLLGLTLFAAYVNARFDTQERNMNSCFDAQYRHTTALFDAQDKLFTEKLLRVEQVLDARLKHLEEK